MSNIPANLKYSKSHEWILEEDGVFTIGLTDYAQSARRETASPPGSPSPTWSRSRRSPTCSPPSPAR